jgi:hypothetical protein
MLNGGGIKIFSGEASQLMVTTNTEWLQGPVTLS